MTPAGIAPIEDQIRHPDDPWDIPDSVETQLREDDEVLANFQAFPHLYQHLKIGWIKEYRERQREEAIRLRAGMSLRSSGGRRKRLNWLIKNTRQGKMYGTVPIEE
jgi:hypothetical protein